MKLLIPPFFCLWNGDRNKLLLIKKIEVETGEGGRHSTCEECANGKDLTLRFGALDKFGLKCQAHSNVLPQFEP